MEGTTTIIPMGSSGVGKTSMIEHLSDVKDGFKIDDSSSSVTNETSVYSGNKDGTQINVIDNPGFFTSDDKDKVYLPQMHSFLHKWNAGINLFLILLSALNQRIDHNVETLEGNDEERKRIITYQKQRKPIGLTWEYDQVKLPTEIIETWDEEQIEKLEIIPRVLANKDVINEHNYTITLFHYQDLRRYNIIMMANLITQKMKLFLNMQKNKKKK